ncbi:tRNA(m5U54)methyltransferase [Microthyrium microscopicum]|uniref:tRNA(M5U54)methyltransferase n=1 Tax=Microthyrium microscopicum TaxID=703497 RepID=A0A6A6U741_9PEZI|nr:tRNA(m5U54)methyltransferase [Microthyrium microscopicum]
MDDSTSSEKTPIPPELFEEITLEIDRLSSSGDGLAFSTEHRLVFVVPFTVPGDTVVAKPYRYAKDGTYYHADFVRVVEPSQDRHDSEVKCGYFAKCAGCQFQMMLPQFQLDHKREVVSKAYLEYVGVDRKLVPEVEPTLASPKNYGYRTKVTPHFDAPPGARQAQRKGNKIFFTEPPPIGFQVKDRRITMDIEDCPLATDAVRVGMKKERKRVIDTIQTFSKGATLLVRENTDRIKDRPEIKEEDFKAPVVSKRDGVWEVKNYETDHKATIKEYIGDYLVTNLANSFFQNNNSILLPFMNYIRERIMPKDPDATKPSYLVDAYCGSGLFTITLSSLFKQSIGIDIDPHSIEFAAKNAKLNNLPDAQTKFMTETASQIFKSIEFPAEETVVVVDPPRKGCDVPFLTQLLKFSPQRIVYVSCNVHTQARDVAILLGGIPNVDAGFGLGGGAYELESLRGCDFFPQTRHVESVAILQRKKPVIERIIDETLDTKGVLTKPADIVK